MTAHKISYHRSNYVLSLISIISLIISFSIFLTNVLLLTNNPQYIAFNEFSATGKYPAIFYYVSIILIAVSIGQFVCSVFGLWSTKDLLNNFNSQIKCMIRLFITGLAISGVIHLVAGIITVVYTRTMGIPLREYMADNLRSNYTGGFGIGYLERQFDRSVDWVQINYQCCGVISYEDYRNGFYYNSFNKYTIVSIVPNSCCIYRDQSQPTKCQMKSVNIYRKGCFDILMWWMETFGLVLSAITLVAGILNLIAAFIVLSIQRQIVNYKMEVRKKESRLRNLNININKFEKDYYDTNTLDETVSVQESKT